MAFRLATDAEWSISNTAIHRRPRGTPLCRPLVAWGQREPSLQLQKNNPVTARVIVNRVWASHFGTGIVPTPSEHRRRSIYVFARRNLRYPIFEAFDRPTANRSCAARVESTTAPQALHLLNSEFSLQIASEFAASIAADHVDQSGRIDAAFRRALARPADATEREIAVKFLARQAEVTGPSTDPLTHLCLSLWNSNEFVFID